VDGVRRIYAFRKVGVRPLYVIVGFAMEDVLVGFRRELVQAAAMQGLFALVTALAVWSGVRSLRRAGEDAVAREKALTSLRESEGRLAATFAAFPDALAISDFATGQYLFVNEGFAKVSGWPVEQVIGRSSGELSVWADQADRTAVVEALLQRGAIDDYDAIFRHRDGTEFQGQISGRVVSIDGKRYLLTITRDLSRQRQLEAQLQQAQRLESVGRLAGGVAHDFNNMLLVILGEAAVLEAELPHDHPERQSVEAILQAAQRSRDLTRQLLAFSRKQVISPRVVDLNALVEATRQPLSRLIGADIRLSFLPTPAPWPVRLDPSQLDQVLMNLVVNARDAMPGGGALTVRTANVPAGSAGPDRCGLPAADYVALSVQDEGIGMTPETLAHVFEPFFTTKTEGKGTGLGLATIYGIARQNGGAVAVESALEKGTTFTMYLPRCEPAAAEAPPPGARTPARGRGTVLLVEDEEAVQRTTVRMLQSLGYTVRAAGSGTEALALAEAEGPIDLLATDVVMPGIKGPALAAMLAQRRPGLRTLFMSGYAASALGEGGVLGEAVHFLQKPFTLDDLARAVQAALEAPAPAPAPSPSSQPQA
jgi:PAS domain S-box-containing protein